MALDNIPTLGPGGFNGNLDKVLVYKNGGSEVACSLLTLTNSALNVAGVYVDAVNQRVGIGAPNPTTALELGGVGASIKLPNDGSLFLNTVRFATNNSSIYVGDINGTGTPIYLIPQGGGTNGSIRLGGGQLALFKGSGSTSATTSLLVQNSAGSTALQVKDDLTTTLYSNLTIQLGSIQLDQNRALYGYNVHGTSLSLIKATGPYIQIGDNNSEDLLISNPSIVIGSTIRDFSSIITMNSTTKGFLPPRMTTAQKNLIASPAAGLMVYDTDLNRPCFYSGSAWVTL